MSNLLEIQKGFLADGHNIKQFTVQPISPGMIAAQTINTLANPNFNRVFYAENTTWMVSITSMDIYNIPSDQIYFTVYKINNNTGELNSYQVVKKYVDYAIVNELVHVSDDKIIFAKLDAFHVNISITYLLVDGDSISCGQKSFIETHPMAKDEYFYNNQWYIDAGIVSFGTDNGNIGGLWRFRYGLRDDPNHYEILTKVEISTNISVLSMKQMEKYTTQDLTADRNMMRSYHRTNPRYVLTQHYPSKSYSVIDTETFKTVLEFTSTQDSVVEVVANSFNAHLYQVRNESYGEELYGRRLIGLVGFGERVIPSGYSQYTSSGYDVIHVDNTGDIRVTRIVGRIKEIVAIDKFGNVYCSVFDASWRVYLRKYSSSGAPEWSTTNTVYTNRRPNVSMDSISTTGNKVITRFDENNNLVITSMDGLQQFNYYYTYKYQYAHVINTNNGSTVSSTNNHTLPKYNGYTPVPIAFYEKRDPSSGLVIPVLLAVALRDSRNSESAKATEILVTEMEPFYYLKVSIVDENDVTVDRGKYKIISEINSEEAAIRDGTNDMKLGDTWQIKVSSFAYLTESRTGVLTIHDRTVKIILKRRDWTRNRYEVRTPQELQAIGDDDLGEYHIMNDIDMTDFQWENIYTDYSKPFLGKIIGNGFTIKNLTIYQGAELEDGYGFIGNSVNATFENMKFENIELNCNGYAGFLTGTLYFHSVYNDSLEEVVKPYVKDVIIVDSTMYVESNSSDIGCIVGYYDSNADMDDVVSTEIFSFSNCIADGININLEGNADRIGGIVGSVGIGGL